jgi:hypothetical protein
MMCGGTTPCGGPRPQWPVLATLVSPRWRRLSGGTAVRGRPTRARPARSALTYAAEDGTRYAHAYGLLRSHVSAAAGQVRASERRGAAAAPGDATRPGNGRATAGDTPSGRAVLPGSVRRRRIRRAIAVATAEHIVTDLTDHVQATHGVGDLLHRSVMRQIGRDLQAEGDAVKAVDHLAEQLLVRVCCRGRGAW